MRFGESPLKDAYRLVVWGPGRVSMERAPPPWELRASRGLGRVAGATLRARRRRLEATLTDALGDRELARAAAREAFATHFANQYVGFSFGKVTRETAGRYLVFDGLEYLERARARGRGVVVAHPHMGLPQLPLHVLGLRGVPVHQVGGGHPEVPLSPVGRWAARTRDRLEDRIAATLHDGGNYVRPVLRALQAGEVVFTACDGTGGGTELGRRQRHTVLGRGYALPVFPGWLAERSGAEVVTLVCHGHGTRQRAELRPVEGAVLERIAGRLDGWLRTWPGQWHAWDSWHGGPGGLLLP